MTGQSRKSEESAHDVSLCIVIPTYRRATRLDRLLTALEPQVVGKPDRRVVVVNDGSHDDAYAKVVERFQTMIEYVALPRNRGISAARNAGVQRATGRYLVFTDDDCVPPPHWLDWLVADLQEYPYVAVVGGPTRALPSKSQDAKLIKVLLGVYPRPTYSDGLLRFVPTANFAIRRDWFDRVGGFDERFSGGEDTRLTYSLKRAGASFHIDESWFTYHDQVPGLWGYCERWFRYGRGDGMNKGFTGDPSIIVSIPPSYASVAWRLPSTIGTIRKRRRHSEKPGYLRLIFGARDLVSRLLYQIGLRRGFKLATGLAAPSDERSG